MEPQLQMKKSTEIRLRRLLGDVVDITYKDNIPSWVDYDSFKKEKINHLLEMLENGKPVDFLFYLKISLGDHGMYSTNRYKIVSLDDFHEFYSDLFPYIVQIFEEEEDDLDLIFYFTSFENEIMNVTEREYRGLADGFDGFD